MPQTKTTQTKPAAPEAPQPEPRKPTAMDLRHSEAKRQLAALQEFIDAFNDMSLVQFDTLKTFKLIQDRNNGCTTPIEEFIVSLVHRYEWADAEGLGLTLDQITLEVEELVQSNVPEEIRRAHFMASRYPLPEPEANTASE
jgi:hypothetical protein